MWGKNSWLSLKQWEIPGGGERKRDLNGRPISSWYLHGGCGRVRRDIGKLQWNIYTALEQLNCESLILYTAQLSSKSQYGKQMFSKKDWVNSPFIEKVPPFEWGWASKVGKILKDKNLLPLKIFAEKFIGLSTDVYMALNILTLAFPLYPLISFWKVVFFGLNFIEV